MQAIHTGEMLKTKARVEKANKLTTKMNQSEHNLFYLLFVCFLCSSLCLWTSHL